MASMASMAQSKQKPELADWVSKFSGKQTDFDPQTRQPTFTRGTVKTIVPWKREGDILTILTNPTDFSEDAVAAARQQFAEIRDEQSANVAIQTDKFIKAEQHLLEAWREFKADKTGDDALIQRILAAEKKVISSEKKLNTALNPGRKGVEMPIKPDVSLFTTFVPPISVSRRGISLLAIGRS